MPLPDVVGRDFLKKADAVVNCKTGELVSDASSMVQPSRPVASLRSGGTQLEDIVECIETNETPTAPETLRALSHFFRFPLIRRRDHYDVRLPVWQPVGVTCMQPLRDGADDRSKPPSAV